MKKLLLLFFSLLALGYMFQACDNSKTYAEMLDEEKDAVNAGSSASYRISPAASTSTAKITAAIGVPNMPAKPAAIPVTRKIPGAFLNGNFLPAK